MHARFNQQLINLLAIFNYYFLFAEFLLKWLTCYLYARANKHAEQSKESFGQLPTVYTWTAPSVTQNTHCY
jgi:bacterioferritin (cytochrome b1)